MRKAHRGLGLSAALTLVGGGLLAMATPTVASARPCRRHAALHHLGQARSQMPRPALVGIGGVVIAQGTSSTCQDPPPPPEPAFNGTPPLLFNGRQGPAPTNE